MVSQKPSPLTVYDLADKAGVSIATISRAVNPEMRRKVSPNTLKRIDRLVSRFGYTPSLAAKHLSKTKYKTIGILIPHEPGILTSHYYSQMLSGAADALLATEYSLKMILLKPDQPLWNIYNFEKGEGVDGLILAYWRTFFSDEQVFTKNRIPCVIINNAEKNIPARFCAGDHFSGGMQAAEYLFKQGHRRIAVLTGRHGAPDVLERLKGFKHYLKQSRSKLDPKLIFDVEFREDKAYEVTDHILAIRPSVTAVFCINDTQAFGVLRRLRERHIACPERISVMGYDDDPRGLTSVPRLTTVRVPVYELAKEAAQDLIEMIEKKKGSHFYQTVKKPVSVIERESVGGCHAKKSN